MVAIVVMALFLVWAGPSAGVAALYGGGGALANTGLLLWRLKRGERDYHCDAGRHLRTFFRSSLERFIVVGSWLALGLGVFELAPQPMLAGFIIALLAWVFAMAAAK